MATSASEKPAAEADVPIDFKQLDAIIKEFKGQKGAVIPILQRTQDTLGYLPRKALQYISKKTLIPLQQLYGVATFYAQFHLQAARAAPGARLRRHGLPRARRGQERSTPCRRAWASTPGETSPDYKMTLEIVYCLGSCGLAPVALVDEKVYGRLAPDGRSVTRP